MVSVLNWILSGHDGHVLQHSQSACAQTLPKDRNQIALYHQWHTSLRNKLEVEKKNTQTTVFTETQLNNSGSCSFRKINALFHPSSSNPSPLKLAMTPTGDRLISNNKCSNHCFCKDLFLCMLQDCRGITLVVSSG